VFQPKPPASHNYDPAQRGLKLTRTALVDLLISGGAGLALCRTVRDNGPAPVLAVSVVDRRGQALAAGVEAFLLKPLGPLQFVSTVRPVGTSAFLRQRS
jgi:CheY-like chemotaxis protein